MVKSALTQLVLLLVLGQFVTSEAVTAISLTPSTGWYNQYNLPFVNGNADIVQGLEMMDPGLLFLLDWVLLSNGSTSFRTLSVPKHGRSVLLVVKIVVCYFHHVILVS